MPIVIGTDNVAVVDEADSFVGRLIDGIRGAMVASDNLTAKEGFAAFWGGMGIGSVIGGMIARSRSKAGKAPIGKFLY